ncbi:PKD domain-containing protein [Pedobacter sp. AW31-3R]|uniref:PKD domain-containing protein n=1 Tax=Pedobacter sp. AW31-3R TaxID=3445781 RepID=UPI003FA07267
MRNFLHTIFVSALLFLSFSSRAQITVGTVDAGPYTPGSTIAATFSTGNTTCLQIGNRFTLYLVSSSGAETIIGSYEGFYSTFVNGEIPGNITPGVGYRLRIKSTAPALTSSDSNPFEIRAGAAVTAKISAPPINTSNPEIFGYCSYRDVPVNLTNQSSSGGKVTAKITNEMLSTIPVTSEPVTDITFDTNIKSFRPGAAHYTVLVKVTMPDGTKGTKAYFIVNNPVNTAFSTTGSGVVCLPLGEFSYGVDTRNIGGIQRNFPGNTYKITWGDDSESVYTICELRQRDNITHTYTQSSCGRNANGKYNVFGININTVSPFCGDNAGQPLSATARVVTVTENKFTGPALGCQNELITFVNTSVLGQNQDDTARDCVDNTVRFNWFVNGQLILADVPKSTNFERTFTAPGTYEIRLESISGGVCQADPVIRTICIQAPPKPSFTLPSNPLTTCAPGVVTPVNTSVIDVSCDPTVNYRWTLSGPAQVTYDGGTSATSKNPTFRFTTPGIYKVKLSVSTLSCQEVTTAEQTIIVNGQPTAELSPDVKRCAYGEFTFGPNSTFTKTTFTGTMAELAGTYTWTVSGGGYDFVSPSTANTKYPTIRFNDFATYTVTVVHTNNCNTVTKTQLLTFTPSPVPTPTAASNTLCYDEIANLTGVVTNGNYERVEWIGTGTFSNANNLITTYTPTAEERAAGLATVTLRLITGLAGDCATVANSLQLTIYPRNTGSNTEQAICSNQTAVFEPVSSVPLSTFRWTATNADGNAAAFAASGTGNINQVLVNNNATANAVVVYTIVPMSNGCEGIPFTHTVTVTPRPVLTATAAQSLVCTNTAIAITLGSNLPGTTYTWTSTATAGITGNTQQTTAAATVTINDLLLNTTTAEGSVTYTITPVAASGCPGNPKTVTIRVSPAVTTALAGNDESICELSNYTLNGNEAIVGTGVWTLRSGQSGVTFTDNRNPKTSVNGLVPGQVYTFRWTITAPGACAPSADEVTITVNTPTVAGTTAGATIVCAGNNEGVITLTGNVGNIEGWQSSTDGGITWVNVEGNTTNTLTYLNLTQNTAYKAIVKNGGCDIKETNSTLITVTPATTVAAAGDDQTLCNELSASLQGNALAAGETGRWTLISGNPNARITNPANPATTVTALVAGSEYVFRWTITGTATCGPTFDEVKVNNLLPLTNTISSTATVVCNGQTVTLTGSTPTGGTGSYTYVWESSTDGTTFTVIAGQTDKDLSLSLTETLTFRRTVVSGACTMASNLIRITAQPPITNNTISAAQEICTGLIPAALTGSLPLGSDGNFNYQWQSSPDGTVWTNISGAVSLNYAPQALTATTWYRRLVSTRTCNGAAQNISAPVQITVYPNAAAMYTFTTDKSCIPFAITAQDIQATLYPDRNATYTWFANEVQIGTGTTFPGYTITNSNESVIIKLVTTSSLGCTSAEFSHAFSTAQDVSPSFTQSTQEGCGPLLVSFVNTSSSLTLGTFQWKFGNGQNSNQTMPDAVTFLPDPTGKDTTYTVTLISRTSCGIDSVTSTVLVKAKPIAVFSPSSTSGCSPMTVTFSNTSPGETNTYYYNFDDGTPTLIKTDKSTVTHKFTTNVARDYVVTMIAENDCGRSEPALYKIRVSPNTILPELVVNGNEKEGCAPFTVNFYNNSKGANSFEYDFADGTSKVFTKTAPETVQHTFTKPGTFIVTLTASNGCSDTTTTEIITVLAQPEVSFSADVRVGCADLPVQFTNAGTDAVNYVWDFGDGSPNSTEFEPRHIYTGTQEYYTVSLTATNALGCTRTTVMNQYIHIITPPVARFNVAPSTVISIPSYTFRFEDESTNNPTKWEWSFGDGNTSTLPNPSHSYLDTGKYVVTLKVTNDQGCSSTTFKNVSIVGVPGHLFVANSFMPGSDYLELREFKAKGSGIKSWRMSIFNKWGQTLWETTKLEEGRPAEGWDGTHKGVLQPQGVYFWKIDVEFINGSAWKGMTYDSSAPKKTGAIHLIR